MTYSEAMKLLTSDRVAVKPTTWGGYVARFDTVPLFSATTVYKGGQLVTHANSGSYDVYSRKPVATPVAEAWDSSNWDLIADAYIETFSDDSTEEYVEGDQVRYQDAVYEATAATTGGTFDTEKWTLISDPTHIVSFRERDDADEDNVVMYNILVKNTLSGGVTYGAFKNDLKMDSDLFKAQAFDESWTSGTASDFEAALTGTSRW